jgi:PPOX class probable F420-dependent enzyme
MTAAEARERFAAARVARLASADAAGRPHLVPIVFVVVTAGWKAGDAAAARPAVTVGEVVGEAGQDTDTIYSAVDAKPKRTAALRRLANVRANPAAALLVDHYEEDWGRLWWVRAEGRGRVLAADAAEARRAIALLRERYPQQRAAGEVLAVDVARWSGWSAAE